MAATSELASSFTFIMALEEESRDLVARPFQLAEVMGALLEHLGIGIREGLDAGQLGRHGGGCSEWDGWSSPTMWRVVCCIIVHWLMEPGGCSRWGSTPRQRG